MPGQLLGSHVFVSQGAPPRYPPLELLNKFHKAVEYEAIRVAEWVKTFYVKLTDMSLGS